jgi:ferredoxin, 2Fe-2S
MTAKVRVAGTDLTLEAREGEDLLEIFQAHDVPIATSCGGLATCGLCRIKVVSGGEALTPIRPQEIVHLGNVAKITGQRLACQSKVHGEGEIVVEIPPVEAAAAKRARKAHRGSRAPVAPRGTVEWRPRVLDPKNEK